MFVIYLSESTNSQHNKAIFRILACLFCLMGFSIKNAKAGQEVSLEEIKQIIPIVEKFERELVNIYIESESWVESKMEPTDQWGKTANYTKGISWINGASGDKMRVDVLKETMGKKGAKSPDIEISYSVSYDGLIGKRVNREIKKGTEIKNIKEAEIMTERPKELGNRTLTSLTGSRFSMHFFFSKETYKSFSNFLKLAISKESVAKTPLKFTIEEFLGADCLKINYMEGANNSVSWWFEPGKGYALRGYKLENSTNKNNGTWLVSFIKVTKLKKVGENIWYPVEVFEETGPSKDGLPYSRVVYRASKIIANISDLDERIFDVDIPEDFKKRYRYYDCKGQSKITSGSGG